MDRYLTESLEHYLMGIGTNYQDLTGGLSSEEKEDFNRTLRVKSRSYNGLRLKDVLDTIRFFELKEKAIIPMYKKGIILNLAVMSYILMGSCSFLYLQINDEASTTVKSLLLITTVFLFVKSGISRKQQISLDSAIKYLENQ